MRLEGSEPKLQELLRSVLEIRGMVCLAMASWCRIHGSFAMPNASSRPATDILTDADDGCFDFHVVDTGGTLIHRVAIIRRL